MSREELVIEIAATLHTADEQGVLEGSCAEFLKPLAEFIERLLTDERKEVLYAVLAFNCGLGCTPQEGYKDLTDALRDTKHLVASARREEREKVREMCAVVMKDFADEYEPGANISVKYLEDKYGTLSGEKAIRQLDLTKELAPSSREEKG